VTTVQGSQRGRAISISDQLAIVSAERDRCRALLCKAEADRAHLHADLADALAEVEHWRTLAEYRENRLVDRQTAIADGTARHKGPAG